jgi:hypothetical protein
VADQPRQPLMLVQKAIIQTGSNQWFRSDETNKSFGIRVGTPIIPKTLKFEQRIYDASLAVLANSYHEKERPIESDVWDGSIAVLQVLVNWKKC